MIRIQHAVLVVFPLALASVVNCSSDSNEIIHSGAAGASATPSGGAAPVAGAAGASAPTAGAATAGAAGAAVQAGAAGALASGGGGGASGGSVGAGGAGGGSAGSATICTPSGSQFDCGNVLKTADNKSMDGYANLDLADGPSSGSDAHQFNCANSEAAPKIFKEQHWKLSGPGITDGKPYKVDLHWYGVVECKNYVGGTGPATDDDDTVSTTVSHNLWIQGAQDNGDHWNTYVFTVTPQSSNRVNKIGPQDMLPDLANSYMINRCPKKKQADHYTFRLDFSSSITVPGGSYINYVEYDTNCRMIANCGAANAADSCNPPYNIVDSVKNAVPASNATTLMQPLANTANPPSRGQWWLVDVTGISPM